jgi:NAD(P)H-flavin reductase
MIAGGVGITPFLSVLRHFRNINANTRAALIWTNKTMEDTFANDELTEMANELNLKIVYTLSREKEVDKYFQGDIPITCASGYVTKNVLQDHLDVPHTAFYLCGPPKMQEFVLGELEFCGIDPASVETEQFTYEKGR